jgi:hypothetical protein
VTVPEVRPLRRASCRVHAGSTQLEWLIAGYLLAFGLDPAPMLLVPVSLAAIVFPLLEGQAYGWPA